MLIVSEAAADGFVLVRLHHVRNLHYNMKWSESVPNHQSDFHTYMSVKTIYSYIFPDPRDYVLVRIHLQYLLCG